MEKLLRKLWERVKYDQHVQKSEWDKVAYSHLTGLKPILDAGCGEGRFISQDPRAIIGIDRNAESVKKCKQQGYDAIQGDIRVLPFGDGAISGIHCSHVIEHFLPSDVHGILSEFDRVLKDGGILVIRSPLLWKNFYNDLTHIRPYNPRAIIRYLTPSDQHSLPPISRDYEVRALKWRSGPLQVRNRYLNAIFNILNRWGFPWILNNGYMLVMRKGRV